MKLNFRNFSAQFLQLLIILGLSTVRFAFGQTRLQGQNSDVLVTYDLNNPEAKTQIPFDKYFTFQILHCKTDKIREVKVYEAAYEDGIRTLKTDYIDISGVPHFIYDFQINAPRVKHDTLVLYFPALKPNRQFDIVVKRGLSGPNLDLAFQLNAAIADGKPDADQLIILKKLKAGANDKGFFIEDFQVNMTDTYRAIFIASFKTFYDDLRNPANFPSVAFLTMPNLNLMDAGYTEKRIKFKWGYVPVRLIKETKLNDMFSGNLPADYTSSTTRINDIDYKGRVSNLDKSIAVMDTIYRNLNIFLFKENDPDFETMRSTLQKVIEQLGKNKYFINKRISDLTDAIQSQPELVENQILIGGTNFSDIKTEGSNIFTLDLGVATLGGFNTKNQMVFLPKFYYGVNIYFRPIDKNTRNETLPSDLHADPTNGPDYNIVAQKSIWQHLSLTVGLTTGSYNNPEFDNLYANTSLLVGAGYRFYRALKITAGTGFLRRESKNPITTEKGVCVSPFISFSADIDFVSTIKDVISPLWK